MRLIERHLSPRVSDALDASRVVMIHGPRQCGKTTLARVIAGTRGGSYVTLDSPVDLQAAQADPLGFLTSSPYPLVIDEIQQGGDALVRMVKQLVDETPTRGRFLLTGSSNFLTVPTISESLAGRVRILDLWPLSEAEIIGAPAPIMDKWFDDPGVRGKAGSAVELDLAERDNCIERLCRSGYPEAIGLTPRDRPGWFKSYVRTVTLRDLPRIADIRRASDLPSLMRWTAAMSATEVDISKLTQRMRMNRKTVSAYLDWLKMVFLVNEAPSWGRNPAAREVRRPKTYVSDAGLAAALLRLTAEDLVSRGAVSTGRLLESFVFNEIVRQASAAPEHLDVFHYRDRKHETDLVIEGPGGKIIAIEVKATSSPQPSHLRSVAHLRDRLDETQPGTFHAGYLLHTGTQALSLGDRLYLRPISSLWTPYASQRRLM